MKLRQRDSRQLEALAEAFGDDEMNSAFSVEEEWAPTAEAAPKKKKKKKTKKAKPALVELVLQTVGRTDLFDARSLKALRLTCKAFRDLIDGTDTLTVTKFIDKTHSRHDALEAWASSPGAVGRTRSLLITGKLPPGVALRAFMAISTHKPPIAKLELDGVGGGGEVLLAAPFEGLRDLYVDSSRRRANFVKEIYNNPSLAGLHSLRLDHCGPAPTLTALLANLSELRHLELIHTDVQGANVDPSVLSGCLNHLESLRLTKCITIASVLLNPNGPALPALRSLTLKEIPSLQACPCLGQLTELSWMQIYGNFDAECLPAVVTALSGGPLQSLRLELYSSRNIFENWNWGALELPHLTHLVARAPRGDVLADVAQARMPQLRRVEIPFNQASTAFGVRAFGTTFPQLRELKLWTDQGQPTGPPPSDAVDALSRDVVPLLEIFVWNCSEVESIDTAASFLPQDSAEESPRWPLLRKLQLSLCGPRDSPEDHQEEYFSCLARAASHCSRLTALCIETYRPAKPAAVEAFVAAAKAVNACPNLKQVAIPNRTNYLDYCAYNRVLKLCEVWPGSAQCSLDVWGG